MQIQVDYLSNRLTVEGPPEDVARAKALLTRGATAAASVIGFGKVLPLPLGGESYEEAGLSTWGCWGDPIAAAIAEDAADRFAVAFDTAQSPPTGVAEALSRQVPGATVTLDCAWTADPSSISASGRWVAGTGGLAPVEATREHYQRVRPGIAECELDEFFSASAPSF